MTEGAAGGRIVHRNRLSNAPDQALFFGFFIVGAASIVVFRLRAVSEYVVILVPVGLMFVYAGIAWASKRFRAREDRVGDNLYYLGFLFTLVSLSFTLWQFNSISSSGNIDFVISNFGVALATTICGLALRVLFNQMREDPVVYEREARMELAEAASAVKAQLDDVAIRMADFMRRVTQQMEEGVSDMTTAANAALQTNVTKFASVGQEVLEKINLAFDTFNEQSARLNLASGRTVDALQKLFERIENIEASPNMLTSRFDPIVEKFHEIADKSAKRTRAHNAEMRRTKELVEMAAQAALTLKSSIDASSASMDQRVSEFSNHLTSSAEAVDKLAASTVQATTAIESQIGAMRNGASALANALTSEIGASETMLAAHKSGLAADLETMRQHREEMQKAIAEAREMVLTLEGTLVSLSQGIVDKLNAT